MECQHDFVKYSTWLNCYACGEGQHVNVLRLGFSLSCGSDTCHTLSKSPSASQASWFQTIHVQISSLVRDLPFSCRQHARVCWMQITHYTFCPLALAAGNGSWLTRAKGSQFIIWPEGGATGTASWLSSTCGGTQPIMEHPANSGQWIGMILTSEGIMKDILLEVWRWN